MPTKRSRRWAILLPTACFVSLLSAERLHVLKTDSIAAATCSIGLLQDKPNPLGLITRSRAAVLDAATTYDLPPEMLAAVIYGHQRSLTRFRRFTDCAGSALGADLSLGLAQVRISTALAVDGLDADNASPREFKAYRSTLLDPASNIHYEAKELRHILELEHRFPGLEADALVREPAAMALAMSEYRAGRQNADRDSARISANALWDLQHMLESSIYIFGRDDADAAQVRDDVRAYLGERYCDGELFNDATCAWWRSFSSNTVAE